MRKHFRAVILAIARAVGTPISDCRTGKFLGRALLLPWRGMVHVIGLETAVRPVFQPQERLTYWKQKLAFTVHEAPDFPNVRRSEPASDQ